MAPRFTREEVLARLRKEMSAGNALFMASCGSGIVAKFLERAGCDMAGVYNAVKLRTYGAGSMMGMLVGLTLRWKLLRHYDGTKGCS